MIIVRHICLISNFNPYFAVFCIFATANFTICKSKDKCLINLLFSLFKYEKSVHLFRQPSESHTMRKLFVLTGKFISDIIDSIYPYFKKYFSLQFFRYGVSGVMNLVFSWFSYFVIYQFIIQKRLVNLGIVTLSGHTASLIVNFILTTFTGFLLQKYVTFTASELRGRKQLVRYVEVALFNLLINYLGLKLLFEVIGIYPSISNVIISIFTTVISYFLQKKYTFRIKNEPKE